MTSREFRERLGRRLRRVHLTVSPELCDKLESYFQLMAVWNRKINLTAFDLHDPVSETFDRLLVEPLLAARHVPDGFSRFIDIGSGGGSPALPLALMTAPTSLILVEVKTRKSMFLREALRVVGLTSAAVETARFEQLLARPELHESLDLLTIRAVRVESRTLSHLQTFVRAGGQLFLFRGTTSGQIAAVPTPLRHHASYALTSPDNRLIVLDKPDGVSDVPRGTLR